MAIPTELQAKIRARDEELNEQLDRAGDRLFPHCDHEGALEILTPACRPDRHLDLIRAGAAVMRFLSADSLSRTLLVDRLRARLQTHPEAGVADCLLYLGAFEDARAYFLGAAETDLLADNAVAVCEHLLDRPGEADRRLLACLDRPEVTPLELLPVRYNLAESLFSRQRFHESLAQFKHCRGVYPHYRDVLLFIAWIRAILHEPGGYPHEPIANAMRVRYQTVRALGSP